MEKFKKYIQKNWKWIVTSIVSGLCFSFWIAPLILAQSNINDILSVAPSRPTIFLLIVISILPLFLVFRPVLAFWVRYENNYKLSEIPFTYVDSIFLLLLSFVLTFFVFDEKILKEIVLSKEIKFWLTTVGISFLIWCGVIKYRSQSYTFSSSTQSKKPPSADFFPDEPITQESEDLLGRKQFVNDLYNQIIKYPFSDSFVFGLYGRWGEGKTSSLNLLKNKLYQNGDVIVFEFDPWDYSSQSALIKGFYEGLYGVLNKKLFLPNIKKFFDKYHRILSSGLKLSGISIDFELSQKSLVELKREIQHWISLTGKKVVILIDDIDRLQNKDEILQILKIVKQSGRFENTMFVISFDPAIVSSYLKEDVSQDPSFLDKIVQAPIHLPAIEQPIIDKFLFYSYPEENHYSAIDKLFQKLQIDEVRTRAFDTDFRYLYESQIKKIFATLRDAKRYLNGLYSTLPVVEKEVNLHDFLTLELIRVFYFEIYKDIWTNPWYYVSSSGRHIVPPDEQKKEKIKEHIVNITKGKNRDEVLLELLKTIFSKTREAFGEFSYGNTEQYRIEKRITDPDVFPKYFMLKVSPEEISDELFESIISDWENTEETSLASKVTENFKNFRQERKLLKLLNKLLVFIPKINAKLAKSLVRVLYKNIDFFAKEREFVLYGSSEFHAVESIIINLLNERIDRVEIEPLLKEILREAPSFEFIALVVDACKEGKASFYTIYENIHMDSLQKDFSKRLYDHFVVGKRDIFEEEKNAYILILYQWGTANQEDKEVVNKYIFSLINKKPKHLGNLIVKFTQRLGTQSQIEYDSLIQRFDEARLHKAIKEYYSDSFSSQEEKVALDLFIRVFEERQKTALNKTR